MNSMLAALHGIGFNYPDSEDKDIVDVLTECKKEHGTLLIGSVTSRIKQNKSEVMTGGESVWHYN